MQVNIKSMFSLKRSAVSSFFKFVILFLFVLSCSRGDNDSPGKVILKVSHNGSEQHPFQRGYEAIADILSRETSNAIEVQIFPASQIGGEVEAIEMVKLGVIASTAASAGGLGAFVPAVDLFNFPFIFRDLDHFYKVLDGPVGQRVAGEIEGRLNCIVLGWWFSGIRNTWNSEHPIHSPDDLKGLKIRVIGSPIVLDTFNTFGAQATNMSWGELYSAIQQGVLDGAETDHTDLLVEKFYEITKYVSTTEHLFLAVALIFSKKQFDKLPPDFQAAVRRAGEASVAIQRKAMQEKTDLALVELKEKGLIFNEVDKSAFRILAEEVYKRNAQKIGGMNFLNEIINQK